MKYSPQKRFLKIISLVLLILCLVALTAYLLTGPEISVQMLLEHIPENPATAASVFFILYIIKSATVFFPLIILEIAVGHFFPPLAALFINFIGILIILTVPYWIGRASGIDAVQKLVKKYPKFGVILDRQQNSSFFLCFFLRIISCLPGDIVTMYLGATKTPFWQNLTAGCIGILPGMVLATLMGESIRNPRSPQFWISAGLIVASSILSVLLYYIYRRRLQKREVEK